MKELIASDALAENVIIVRADARPALNRVAGCLYAVYSSQQLGDVEGVFQGLVTDRDISIAPQRIFADLLDPHPIKPIYQATPLTEVEKLFDSLADTIAVVDKQGEFIGAVTRTSVLRALLKRERELLNKTRELNQQIATDHRNLAAWSTRLSELHAASRTLLSVLAHTNLEQDILQTGIEALSKLLQARYGAIGIVSEQGELTHFIHTGISDEITKKIDRLPEGKGLLGVVIHENAALRIENIAQDERSAGFPAFHPMMKTLLAVPISNLGRVYGRIYLCDKLDSSAFSVEDELLAMSFAMSLSLILDNAREVEEIKENQQHLYQLAHFDTLTSLPNRELAYDRIHQAIAQCCRQQCKLAILFADLDNFKHINDSLGHSVGDELLKAVARRLREGMRENDTVARLGGDEFLILLPSIESVHQVITVVQNIKTILQPVFRIGNHEIYITCSIGVSVYPDDSEHLEELLRDADTAMYHAKNCGRNNFQFFTTEMNLAVQRQMRLVSLLSQSLEKRCFFLNYQPQIDLLTGRMIGVEALLRWHTPELGLVSPAEFIPVAESSGLICAIGDWVLTAACQQGQAWLQQGCLLHVAVNLSSIQFHQHNLVSKVANILAETGFPAHFLELEITEGIMLADKHSVLTTLGELKALGVEISIDDFGTGYSSLSYLKRMPIDKIKIDQSFVRDLADDPNDAAIVKAIIAMTHGLNLDVIAEGVETEAQLSFLLSRQCHKAQGYYFSKPVSAEAISELWHDKSC